MLDIEVLQAIGPRMESARQSNGMTLRQAALVLGMSKSTLSRLECGEAEALVGVLMSMAELYGVSTDYLIYGTQRYSSCPTAGRMKCKILFAPKNA